MPLVLFTPTLMRGPAQPYYQLLKQAGFEVEFPPPGASTFESTTLLPLLARADAMLASTEPITDAIMAQCPRLRVIARWGVGYDAIDIPAATRRGIVVTITPGVLEESVAEHTLAMLLAVTRGLLVRDAEVRSGTWSREVLPRAAGKTLGLVGLGRIGRSVAAKAQALGMQVIAYDPLAKPETVAQSIRLVPLDELLATSDFVSLHAPATAETQHLIRRETLARMKTGAVLVNTARGPLVHEGDLYEALRSGHLLGAALDVFQTEPLPLSSPLVGLKNVLLCTHMGGLDDDTARDAPRLAAQCILDLHAGHWPQPYVVNKELGPRWQWAQ